ncbi:MAG: hypothetical protein LBJ97_04815 [Mycoplasmataceae bacterium]|nr:hypothetical protein [Mycoplasmataceae bacterium]
MKKTFIKINIFIICLISLSFLFMLSIFIVNACHINIDGLTIVGQVIFFVSIAITFALNIYMMVKKKEWKFNKLWKIFFYTSFVLVCISLLFGLIYYLAIWGVEFISNYATIVATAYGAIPILIFLVLILCSNIYQLNKTLLSYSN